MSFSVHTFEGPVPHMTAPSSWSTTAVRILAEKYARHRVPEHTTPVDEAGIPLGLQRRIPVEGTTYVPEIDARDIIRRIVRSVAYWAIRRNGANPKRELLWANIMEQAMLDQAFSPNSPQWFNQGLYWAYGLLPSVHYRTIDSAGKPVATDETHPFALSSACYLTEVNDSLLDDGGIYDWLKTEGRIFRAGAGSGTNISSLRAKGAPLSGGGTSSGALSFVAIADTAAGSIKSGGTTRRSAKMLLLDSNHPDLDDFISEKLREEQKVAALSLGAEALAVSNDPLALRVRATSTNINAALPAFTTDYRGEAYATVGAQNANRTIRWLQDALAERASNPTWRKSAAYAWACGDPGWLFDETVNAWHTAKAIAPIRTTNPCGEFLHLDGSSCTLGSINLIHAFNPFTRRIDDTIVSQAAHNLALLLDKSLDCAASPNDRIATITNLTRPLGVGYTNLGNLLMRLGVSYASIEGRTIAAALASLMTATVYATSAQQAALFGPCKAWDTCASDTLAVLSAHVGALTETEPTMPHAQRITEHAWASIAQFAPTLRANIHAAWSAARAGAARFGLRSLQATVIAPAGTIGQLLDSGISTGIEPLFDLVTHKSLTDGSAITASAPYLREGLTTIGCDPHTIDAVEAHVTQGAPLPALPAHAYAMMQTAAGAFTLSAIDHLAMIAAVTPHISGGISKSVNLPATATIDDVLDAAEYAYRHGVKAFTVYRNESKLSQPLSRAHVSVCPACSQPAIIPVGACAICTSCGTSIGGCG